jgi:lipoyl-dependent peroxiredoxin
VRFFAWCDHHKIGEIAEIDLGPEGGAFSLAARLYVSLPGMERATAQRLVEAAHQVCPYSRATHGNIAVETTLV